MRPLDLLFAPRHVAVIGASSTPGKLGNNVVRNLLKGGFPGRISPINATGAAVENLTTFRSLSELAAPADVAFVVVPAGAVVEAIKSCAATGVKFAIIGASGFAELGTADGFWRQAAITEIARAHGMRVVGPNTNGILSTHDKLPLGYNASHAEAMRPGCVSVVSHSGALFDGVARRLNGFGAGLAKFIPIGNEADLTMLDFIEFLIDDPVTQVIGLVVEGLSDGPGFRRLARKAMDHGKPIVALKIGRSAAGAGAALAHSSRLAGSARAYAALFRECGVAMVPTVEALAGACAVLAANVAAPLVDRRLVCVSSSGAGGALIVDVASDRGLKLAGTESGRWEPEIAAEIALLPTAAEIRQPVDLGSLGDWSLLSPVFDSLNRHSVRGPTLVYAHMAAQQQMTDALFKALSERKSAQPTPVVILAPGGLSEALEARYADAGIPVFHDTATCFDSLACAFVRDAGSSAATIVPPVSDVARQAEVSALLRRHGAAGKILSELDSAEILRRMGVPMVPSIVVNDAGQACREAASLGGSVVLKALVPGIAHKNQHGLVEVGLKDNDAVAAAFARLRARAETIDSAGVTYLVQPMLSARGEIILGISVEEGLGPFLVFGLGGVNAELIDEVMLLPIPIDPRRIFELVAASRVGRLIVALCRGDRTVLDGVTETLAALQMLVAEQGAAIGSVDINPMLISEDGCIAVDALVVLA